MRRHAVLRCRLPGPIYLNSGQGWSQFYQGTGVDVGASFTLMQIRNPGTSQIVLQIYIGYSGFVDHRQIPLSPAEIPVIVSSTASNTNPADILFQIADKSGQFFQNAADGLNYFLVNRTSMNTTNASYDDANLGVAMAILAGPVSATAATIAVLPSVISQTVALQRNYVLPFSLQAPGSFWLEWLGGARKNGSLFSVLLFEIYQGIPALGSQP